MTRLSGATAAQGARHNSSRGKSPSLNGSKSDTIPVSSKAGAIIIESYAIKKISQLILRIFARKLLAT